MKRKRKKKRFDLELRPHHVVGFAGHEAHPELYKLSDKKYIVEFRKQKKDFHSNKLIICWRNTIKRLHKNPDLKFRYVKGMDSVCRKCEHKNECHNPKHKFYKIVKQWDNYAIKYLPELKFGKIYNGYYLRKLFKKKGWLKS